MSGGLRSTIRPVRAPSAKSVPRQVWEMLAWGGRLITTPNDYRAHGLYKRGKTRKDAMRFLSVPRAKALMWPLNKEHERMENKLLFESHYRSVGLPVPNTLAVLGAAPSIGEVPMLAGAREIREFLVESATTGVQMAIKPIDRWGGVGVIVISGIDNDEFILSNGDRRVVAKVVEEATKGVWLVQERIVQHPELAELNESSLNTLRLGTYRRENGDVEIIFAKLRIGRADSQLDSSSLGGFTVWIDPTTGTFADRAFKLPKYSLDPITRHPDSGVVFSGRVHPHWNEVVSMSTAFAQNAGDNKFIGWDIATTKEGPLFVEGNHSWDVQGAQLDSTGMLTDEFVAMYNEDTGAGIDVTRVPPFHVLRALSDLRKRNKKNRH